MIVVTSRKDGLDRTDGEVMAKISRIVVIFISVLLGCVLLGGLYAVVSSVWRRIRNRHSRDQQQEKQQEQKLDDQHVWKLDPAYIV